MKTKLYIVRHAETTGNIEKRLTGRKDYELTKKGVLSAGNWISFFNEISSGLADAGNLFFRQTGGRGQRSVTKSGGYSETDGISCNRTG